MTAMVIAEPWQDLCDATDDDFWCTRPADHDGDHAARATALPLAGVIAIGNAQDGYLPGVLTGLALAALALAAGVRW